MGSVDLAKLHQVVPGHAVIRVMPNTPLAVGAGMTAIAPDSKVSSEMIDAAKTIFGSCGEVEVVAEVLSKRSRRYQAAVRAMSLC